MHILEKIRNKAKSSPRCIVLPEATEERTLRAADLILEDEIAELVLLGSPEEISRLAEKWDLQHISKATIVDPNNNPKKEEYIKLMLEIRANKGLSREEAEGLVVKPLYLAAVMLKAGDVDGEVAGADNITGDVLRPALQYVKTKPGVTVVSGSMIMTGPGELGEDGVLLFADCAVNPEPNAHQLAEIAIETAKTAQGIVGFHKTRVAMLSFSTKGSAKHPNVDKVVEATRIAKEMNPDLKIDGELQADAAIIPGIGSKKAPGSKVAGRANVLVFPNLEVGNIAHKLVQRFSGGEAIGPILQGLAAPINDLSRGCTVEDIINLVAITVCQAQDLKH